MKLVLRQLTNADIQLAHALLKRLETGVLLWASQRDDVLGVRLGFGAGEGESAAGEEAVQGVVVGRRDRVKLVIVAAGTPDAQAHHGLSHVVQNVLDREIELVALRAEPAGDRQISRRDNVL